MQRALCCTPLGPPPTTGATGRAHNSPLSSSTRRWSVAGHPLGEADRSALDCFHSDGFAVLEPGILSSSGCARSHDEWLSSFERWQREIMHRWWGDGPDALNTDHVDHEGGRRTPVAGTRSMAATFLEMLRLGGEEALGLLESPRVLALACRALGCDEVVLDRVSCGDPLTLHGDSPSQGGAPSPDGWQRTDAYNDPVLDFSGVYSTSNVPKKQFIWHTDRSGRTQHEMPQVYFRTVLDPQLGVGSEGDNARIRFWPGSQYWSEERLEAQLHAMTQAEGGTRSGITTQDQPEQVLVDLTPQQTLMWTTATLHSTELQRGPGPRRCMEWRYLPSDPSRRATSWRDAKAVQQWFPEWETWPQSRRRLWGLDEAMLADAQCSSPHLSALSSAVVPKASM